MVINHEPAAIKTVTGGTKGSENKSNEQLRILKLICVGFKEAPLDSPSFRASANYFHQQLESIEQWIEQVTKFSKGKFQAQLEDFEKVQHQVCELMLPPSAFLNSGALDGTESTPDVIKRFQNSIRQVVGKIFIVLHGNPTQYNAKLMALLEDVLKPYKEARKNFEYYQSKYDSFLDKYQVSKYQNTDPSTMREDAFQLFEVRKKYLHYSLNLVLRISVTNNKISESLIDIISSLKAEDETVSDDQGSTVVIFTDALSNFRAAKHWFHTSIEAHKSLMDDIKTSKIQVEKSFTDEITPNRDIDHYNLDTVVDKLEKAKLNIVEKVRKENDEFNKKLTPASKNSTLDSAKKQTSTKNGIAALTPNKVYEKSGWLYMKTTVGVPARTVWVRRWCFVKKSVFGMLVLAPSKNFVQETDKFGILLTTFKYNHTEERKFCFDLQISDSKKNINIVFQADSYSELEDWFKCFSYGKEKLVSKAISKEEYELAFLRFPPIFIEYACSSSTSVDSLLTTTSECTSLVEQCGAKWNAYGEVVFPEEGMFKLPQIATPVMSKLTKLSILASNFVTSCDIPDAITANLWGSVNWCKFFLDDVNSTGFKLSTQYMDQLRGKTKIFPSFYPSSLRSDELQFKSMFPMSIDGLVLKFDCALSPNDRQDFLGICFFTKNDAFFYMNSTGFLSLATVPLKDLASFEVIDGKYIGIYRDSDLLMKIKVAPDIELQPLVEKLNYLIENVTINKVSDDEEVLLKRFKSIDVESKKLLDQRTKMLIFRDDKLEYIKTHEPVSAFLKSNTDKLDITTLKSSEAEFTRRREKLSNNSIYSSKINVPVEPKALMHLMFGENSICFPKLFREYDEKLENLTVATVRPWVHYTGNNVYLREFHLKTLFPISFITNQNYGPNKTVIIQKLIKLQDDYCEVENDHGEFQVPFVGTVRLKVVYVISRGLKSTGKSGQSSNSSKRSVLEIYLLLENVPIVHNFAHGYMQRYLKRKFEDKLQVIRKLIHSYYSKMGNHGQLIKAVKIGGRITSRETQRESKTWVDNREYHKIHSIIMFRVIIFNHISKGIVYFLLILKSSIKFTAALLTNITLLNKFVLGLLILSGVFNVFLSGKSTLSYWRVHKASKLADGYKNGDLVMERALYLQDLDLLTKDIVPNNKDIIYKKFIDTDEYSKKYKDVRFEIAKRRNDLLVELKILTNMESEVMKGDYIQFLAQELSQCDIAKDEYPHIWNNASNTRLKDYCQECKLKYSKLGNDLL